MAAAEVTGHVSGSEETPAESPDEELSQETENKEAGASIIADDKDKRDEPEDDKSLFECNICLDTAHDAVISLCGHLFCWPCLHQWLETRPNRKICPVCKAGISKEKVVPLYGRGSTEQKDPREKPIPPRPRGQRPEPETNGMGGVGMGTFGNQFFGNGNGGFQMSFGIGAFPFGIFATNFNFGGEQAAPPGTAQYEEEQFLQKIFLWVAAAFILWLMVA